MLPALSVAGARVSHHAPFLPLAHRTGRAGLPHPALRLMRYPQGERLIAYWGQGRKRILVQRVLAFASIPFPGWPPDARCRPEPRVIALPRLSLAAIDEVLVLDGFWRLHLPTSLRSTGVTRLQRYYERSDCARAFSSAARSRSPLIPRSLPVVPTPTTPAPACLQYWQSLDRDRLTARAADFALP